jgi:hypothetical protein
LIKNRVFKKTMADRGSTPAYSHAILFVNQSNGVTSCHCCGKIGQVVGEFPCRGYGHAVESLLVKKMEPL